MNNEKPPKISNENIENIGIISNSNGNVINLKKIDNATKQKEIINFSDFDKYPQVYYHYILDR